EDDAGAGRTADTNRTFFNRWEDRVPGRAFEEAGEARVRLLEDSDGVLRFLYILGHIHSLGCGGGEETENQQKSYADRFRYHMTLLSGRMLERLGPAIQIAIILLGSDRAGRPAGRPYTNGKAWGSPKGPGS